ncbi:MAG: hypothetical protein P8H98_01510 [Flavobacteriales bacterium]|nr:hypothetical protein [Flavobacteriales bacterium]
MTHFQIIKESPMNGTSAFHLVLAFKKNKAVKEGRPKIVICVIAANNSERWEQMSSQNDKKEKNQALKECFSKQWKKYRRIGWNEQRHEANTKADAYRMAYQWQMELATQKRPSEVHGDGAQNKHNIYAFEMSPEVWLDKKFESENEHIQKEQQSKTIAFYVGQTSKSIEERYLAHISDPKTSSKWGKKYFKSPFSNAFKQLNKQLIQKYFEDHALLVGEPLSYGMSIIHEEQFTAFLREEGYGAYSR